MPTVRGTSDRDPRTSSRTGRGTSLIIILTYSLKLGPWPVSPNACSCSAAPLGCALAALWATPGAAPSPTLIFSRRHARAERRRPPRRGRRRAKLGRRRLRQAALGQRRRSPRPARSSATSTSSGSRNSPGRCRQPIVGSLQGGERTEAGPQPGLSDASADARRQARFLRPRGPDVAAGQPRA